MGADGRSEESSCRACCCPPCPIPSLLQPQLSSGLQFPARMGGEPFLATAGSSSAGQNSDWSLTCRPKFKSQSTWGWPWCTAPCDTTPGVLCTLYYVRLHPLVQWRYPAENLPQVLPLPPCLGVSLCSPMFPWALEPGSEPVYRAGALTFRPTVCDPQPRDEPQTAPGLILPWPRHWCWLLTVSH